MLSLRYGLFLAILLLPVALLADSQRAITTILQKDEPPVGIVFEIITADREGLNWALPLTHVYIKQLHKQFPALPIAVVSHGQEQFALQSGKSAEQPEVHNLVQSLTGNDIPVYVCGTYAGWRGLSDEDFPEYVNVAAAGPAQINDYVSLGYTRVLIRQRPH